MPAVCPAKSLARFIPPTLLIPGEPFDSDSHLFEPKWDGMCTLAFIERGGYRPKRLPPGIVLDGEIVVMNGERPDLERLLAREQARAPPKVRSAARSMPATYVAFDQLCVRYETIMERSLSERREQLERALEGVESPRAVVSEGDHRRRQRPLRGGRGAWPGRHRGHAGGVPAAGGASGPGPASAAALGPSGKGL